MRIVVAAVVTALVAASSGRQQPARDAASRGPAGTAVLGGVVVADDTTRRPIHGAIVTINHVDRTYGDTAISDDLGRFEFRGVPAGRYLLAADKDGFLRTRFGASRPGRAGTPIAVADGQAIRDLTLPLVRGAVLTGRVTGSDGEPIEGVEIALQQVVTIGGERRLVDAAAPGRPRTDDLGEYRIWGLAPGEYILCATLPSFMSDAGAGIVATTVADVTWARAQMQNAAAAGRAAGAEAPDRPSFALAPVYYPNALQRAGAGSIVVASGEERTGVDVVVPRVPTWRVEGTVVAADGVTPVAASVYLADRAGDSPFDSVKEQTGPRFAFAGVAPGEYALVAQDERTKDWASADVVVAGGNQTIALTLQPSLTATGRVVFQGASSPPDASRVRVWLTAVATGGGVAIAPPPVAVAADGSFVVRGLLPASYRLSASVDAGAAGARTAAPGPAWTLRSATMGSQDLADLAWDVRPGSTMSGITVTMTDRVSELSGRLQDASGRSAPDYFIVVFSSDARTWFARSRRIAETRPASDGHYAVRGLPAGEYLIAALTDVEPNEWFDPGFLRTLAPKAMKIALGDGEIKVQNIAIQ